MSAIGSDDDIPDPMEGKKPGLCPWCYSPIFDDVHLFPRTILCNWEHGDTEAENRTRYATERQNDDAIDRRIIRESRKYGAGREV